VSAADDETEDNHEKITVGFEVFGLLLMKRYNAVYPIVGSQVTFRRKMSPLPSGSKNKRR
jgi:hypothetical protein